MISRYLAALVVGAVVLSPGAGRAQSPASIGSATSAFGTAVTQARDADAVVWNPALLGIQSDPLIRDVPVGSFRLLGVHVRRAPSSEWLDRANGFGLLGGGIEGGRPWSAMSPPLGGGNDGGAGDVVWLASATGTYGLAISSHARGLGRLGVDEADTASRALATVLTVGAARDVIRGPQGSVLRVGVGAKARWTHLHGRGMPGGAGSNEVFVEQVIRNVPGASLDAGAVFVARPGVRVGVSVTDVLRLTWRPAEGPRRRGVVVLADGGIGEVYGPQADETDSGEGTVAAERLYASTVPASWLRAGVSTEARFGVASLAVEARLRSGGLDDGVPSHRVSASYELPVTVPVPVRVGVAGGQGGLAWSLGWISPDCRLPWSISVGQERSARGAASLSFSASFGLRTRSACGLSVK
jgi:hypothetical protein